MGYTSTNSLGHLNTKGDLVAGATAPNRNGVRLVATATGTMPAVEAVGDDTSVDLRLLPASTGGVQIGSSGTPMNQVIRGASTFVYPALAANAWGASTVTATGVSTKSIVSVQVPSSMSTNYVMTGAYASGADEITVGFLNNAASTQGTGFSTSDVLRWAAFNFNA